jgi:hypothetical protein
MKASTHLCFLSRLGLICGFFAFLLPAIAATQTLPTEQDRQVLEALMMHLLSDPEFDMTDVATNGATIVLHTRTPEKTGFLGHDQIQGELDGRKLPRDAENDLRRRNKPQGAKPDSYEAISVPYTNLTFAAGVVVTNLNEMIEGKRHFRSFEKAQPKARGWLEAYLPGYSKNNKVAVVRAATGPWAHAAMLTAVLEKTASGWKVKWINVARFA